jgi:hypothetical protein
MSLSQRSHSPYVRSSSRLSAASTSARRNAARMSSAAQTLRSIPLAMCSVSPDPVVAVGSDATPDARRARASSSLRSTSRRPRRTFHRPAALCFARLISGIVLPFHRLCNAQRGSRLRRPEEPRRCAVSTVWPSGAPTCPSVHEFTAVRIGRCRHPSAVHLSAVTSRPRKCDRGTRGYLNRGPVPRSVQPVAARRAHRPFAQDWAACGERSMLEMCSTR